MSKQGLTTAWLGWSDRALCTKQSVAYVILIGSKQGLNTASLGWSDKTLCTKQGVASVTDLEQTWIKYSFVRVE